MKKRTRNPVVTVPEKRPVEQKLQEASPLRLSWRPHAWRILSIWAVALAAYSNSFRSGLVLDNFFMIGQDPRIRALTWNNLHLILTEELWYKYSTTGLFRPLTTFSYLLNYSVLHNGANPGGYHAVNLVLHLANIVLVYLLGLLVLEEAVLAWALAAVWGLHPLLIESVTNLVGRADLLAAFGVIAGLLCHVQTGRSQGRGRLAWLAGLAVAAAIGIFSKESAAVLPGILLLYDLTWDPAARWKDRWKSYVAILLPFAVFFKLRADLLAREPIGVVPFLDNPLLGADFWTARLTAIKIIGKYIGLFLWPSGLSADYSYDAVPLFGWSFTKWEDLAAWIALFVCIAAAVIAIRCYRRAKPAFFFILFFFIALSPVSNLLILIGTDMAERFLYLPLIGLAGCAVFGLRLAARRMEGRWPGALRAALTLVIFICAALAARTFVRNSDWVDELHLGASEVVVVPRSFKSHLLLASARLNSKPPDLDGAVNEIERMLPIIEGLPDEKLVGRSYAVAGLAFRRKGDKLAPADGKADANSPSAVWYRKALSVLLRGVEVDRAVRENDLRVNREHGKTANPNGWPPVYLELGRVYRRLAEPQKALDVLTYGRLRRNDDEFSEELSFTRLAMSDPNQAQVALMEGLVLNPNSTRLAADLAQLYRRTSPQSCALRTSGSVSVNLECPLVHEQLCTASRNISQAYAQNGQPAKAAATARTAVKELGCPVQLFR